MHLTYIIIIIIIIIIIPLFAYLLTKKLKERAVMVKAGKRSSVPFHSLVIGLMIVMFLSLILIVQFV